MFNNHNAALIECAAAIMQQEQIEDVRDALHRAAKRLNFTPTRWPKAEQVRLALLTRLQLFDPDRAARIALMRHAAMEAIAFFAQFQARVVGGVVDGSAPAGSTIQFECICEHPELLRNRLLELNIPAEQHQTLKAGAQRTSFIGSRSQGCTWFEFTAGAFNFQLRVLAIGERGFPAELSADAGKLSRLVQQARLMQQESSGTYGF